MLKEEYEWLKQKHLANGLDSREAHAKITEFKEGLDLMKQKMKAKKKSEKEIELKLQTRFEEEFQRLCCEQ